MIKGYFNEGESFAPNVPKENGIVFDRDRDITVSLKTNPITGVEMSKEYSWCFVGFVTDNNDDTYIVFPKHYEPGENLEAEASLLFKVITSFIQKSPHTFYGGKDYVSNYPFKAFQGIYDYYEQYGLYCEKESRVRPYKGKKFDVKHTLKNTNYYLVSSEVVAYPFYYRNDVVGFTFLTECMVFAINYSIRKFPFLIGHALVDFDIEEDEFISNTNTIIEYLDSIRQTVFNDRILQLIDDLIEFYSNIRFGGSYYLKHYAFSSIWEQMVEGYLNRHYNGINPITGRMQLSNDVINRISFSKVSFYPNKADATDRIEIDHYAVDKGVQLIFDAKYKNYISGIDYKQFAYYVMLNRMREKIHDPVKYSQTVCSLVVADNRSWSNINFEMDPLYNYENADIIVFEEHLNIKIVIEDYLINEK